MIIDTKEETIGGVDYITETYKNGTVVKKLKPQPLPDDYEPPTPKETQLDRIEAAVNDIAKNNTSYAEMAQAIAEGVNDIE